MLVTRALFLVCPTDRKRRSVALSAYGSWNSPASSWHPCAGMQRRKENSTRYVCAQRKILWHVELSFPSAQHVEHLPSVDSSTTIRQVDCDVLECNQGPLSHAALCPGIVAVVNGRQGQGQHHGWFGAVLVHARRPAACANDGEIHIN
jgi:hypothetical protein